MAVPPVTELLAVTDEALTALGVAMDIIAALDEGDETRPLATRFIAEAQQRGVQPALWARYQSAKQTLLHPLVITH
jgi:hypothetical protein